ncbi:MAG: hypothetical protein ACHBN1_32105 [Heteroscytonema crispum UTEX LB 1556]
MLYLLLVPPCDRVYNQSKNAVSSFFTGMIPSQVVLLKTQGN